MAVIKLVIVTLFVLPISAQHETNKCMFKVSSSSDPKYFDLSSLGRQVWQIAVEDNRRIDDSSHGEINKTLVAFLSPCNSVESFGHRSYCPDQSASVCIAQKIDGKWKEELSNVGGNSVKKWSVLNDSLTIILSGAKSCPGGEKFETGITFSCVDKDTGPVLAHLSDCKVDIIWPTRAACPLYGRYVELWERCLIPGSGVTTVDLRPLRHPKYYTVYSPEGDRFDLNICGTVVSSPCGDEQTTSCMIKNGTNFVIGGIKGAWTKLSESGPMLVYKAKGGVKTTVEFVCNTSIAFGEPKLRSTFPETYIFEFQSIHACPKGQVDCRVYDNNNNFYDLTTLEREIGNWEVQTEIHKIINSTFYINVCKSLNSVEHCNFRDGPVGVCQTTDAGTSINLGMVVNGPEVKGEGSLQISYSGGDQCLAGARHRTIIKFQCAKYNGMPVLENQSADCVTSFTWPTSHACPLKVSTGENCALQEPFYGNTINMSKLHNNQTDYNVETEEGLFRINLCGSLVSPCNNKKNVSICLVKTDGQQIPVGYSTSKIEYSNGAISMKLYGDECSPGVLSTVYVQFICDHHGYLNTSQPQFFSVVPEACKYFFIWKVHTACPSFKEYSCTTTGENGTIYDLSPLSNPQFNYIVLSKTSNSYMKYFINICRPIVFKYRETCQYNSGVCQYNVDEPNILQSFRNIGDAVKGQLLFKNGTLTLEYSDGDICLDPLAVNVPHTSATISFYCSPYETNSRPVFDGAVECNYRFSWRTAAACPVGGKHNSTPEILDTGNCTARNYFTQHIYDFTPLMLNEITIKSESGDQFHLQVCESLTTTQCGNGTGVCLYQKGSKETKAISAGIANADLKYRPGALYLNYSGGDECAPGIPRNTLIEFICPMRNTTDDVRYIDETSNCTYLINWFTKLACEAQINCVLYDGERKIDLYVLSQAEDNYIIISNNSEFFINVCAPLVSLSALGCPGGSAACFAERKSDGTLANKLSLGYPIVTPILHEGKVALKYPHGSRCPYAADFNLSSQIVFSCDPKAGQGSPEFNAFDDCEYQFTWRTSVICDDTKLPSCVLKDNHSNSEIDFYGIQSQSVYKIPSNISSYIVRLCAVESFCDEIVCKYIKGTWVSYGNHTELKYDSSGNSVHVYVTGNLCSEGKNLSAHIVIHCSRTVDEEEPRLISENECDVTIQWNLPSICEVIAAHSSSDAVSTSSVNTAALVSSLVILGIVITLLAFLRKQENRVRLRKLCCCLSYSRYRDRHLYSEANDDCSDL